MRSVQSALLVVVLAAAVCGLFSPTTPAIAQAAFDSQSLVGEWAGTWARHDRPGEVNGPYYMKIEKVEGTKVHGQTESRLGKSRWTGVLEGTRLTFNARQGSSTDLSVDARTMTGSVRNDRGVYDLSLSKK